MRDSEPEDDGPDEVDNSCSSRACYGHDFDPLGELVDCHQEMCVTSARRFLEWTHHVESPLGKRPGEWYGLQLRCGCVRFSGEHLAPVAYPDYLLGFPHCCGPVESRSKGFCHQGSTAGMVSAGSFMYVMKQCPTICRVDAALQDTRCAALVEFSVDDREGFRAASDAPGFCYVLGQLLAQHVCEKGLRPYGLNKENL